MSSASTIYYGPDSSNYASVGSVGLNESVQVYAVEKNWFFIESFTGATTKKRGYVPYNSINNAANVASSVPTRSFTDYADVSNQALTVYTDPGTSTLYPSPGTVYAGEGFTRIDFKRKFIQATRNLLRNIAPRIPVTDIAISSVSATLNSGENNILLPMYCHECDQQGSCLVNRIDFLLIKISLMF